MTNKYRRPGSCLREHPHRPDRQQGRRQGAQSEGEGHHLPPKEEPSILRHLRQVKLQLREAFPLARPKTRW
jgi:hypothetical protein